MQINADTTYVQRAVLIILLALITLSFFHSPGQGDVRFWLKWIETVDAHGPFMSFESRERTSLGLEALQEAYPPFASLISFSTAKLSHMFSTDYFTALKISLTFFLFLSSFIFWIWTRDFFITAIFHFSLLLNSVMLVYIDIYFVPTLILSLWAIKERNLKAFTIFYSISCLIKWQPIIISPFILLYILNIKKAAEWKQIDFKGITFSVLSPLILIVIITFSLFGMPFLKSFASAVTEPYLSGDALNFGWIMTYFLHVFFPDKFGYLIEGEANYIMTTSLKLMLIPKLLFFISYAIAFLAFFKKEKSFENLIYYSLVGFLAYFIFNTGAHENHLFIIFGTDGKGLGFSRVAGVDITLLFSLLNVVFYLLIWNRACFKWNRTNLI
ncbi:MAG: hypothetical protein HY761_07805 [Candidatus Omnitrophica bacterium]|nr:hypothetical protein [Candidatus Omnitrophota bacterium]